MFMLSNRSVKEGDDFQSCGNKKKVLSNWNMCRKTSKKAHAWEEQAS